MENVRRERDITTCTTECYYQPNSPLHTVNADCLTLGSTTPASQGWAHSASAAQLVYCCVVLIEIILHFCFSNLMAVRYLSYFCKPREAV